MNSVSGICLTKLDVLDGLKTIRVCVGYKGKGDSASASLMDIDSYKELEPIYEDLPGWDESTVGAKSLEELPENARAYIRYIEETQNLPRHPVS